MNQLARYSLNQATIKYVQLEAAVQITVAAGFPAIGTWREPVQNYGLERSAKLIRNAGLRVSSHCRGGFLTATEASERRKAIENNLRAIEETAILGAPTLVLVVGGLVGSKDLYETRARVADGISELVDPARAAGITLAIEALHPVYAADRAVINSLRQANDLAEQFPADTVGVVVDTFHIWHDSDLIEQIARAGFAGRIASYQVCDWLVPQPGPDPLLWRGYVGDGWINFDPITRAVLAGGYPGDIECEIFNQSIWDSPPALVAQTVAERFLSEISPSFD